MCECQISSLFLLFFILFLFTDIYFEKHKDLSLYLDLSKNTFTAKFYTTPRENEEIFRIHENLSLNF